MKPTEDKSAEVVFADWLLPLAYANRRRRITYLDRGSRRQSYWSAVKSRTGGMERLSGAACDAAAMLAWVGDYWARTNEPALTKLLPYLEKLRQRLTGGPSSDPQEQRLTEFVYPLF
jgi:hypothetical protein